MNHDPRMTFQSFVVGPANRLAFAAARRSAESPGTSYNPLFLYSASGMGKSHILSAIAHHALQRSTEGLAGGAGKSSPGPVKPSQIIYQTLEGFLEDLQHSLEKGGDEATRKRYEEARILLLDDIQFLTGQGEAQEMLLATLDRLAEGGGQVVLASDRPPAEINGLDERLLSRFSGGLIVDIGQPDYETRVAILQRKSEERGVSLAEGVAPLMARISFPNVRELEGALNLVLAVQDVEERPITAEELPEILGKQHPDRGAELRRVLREAGGGGEEEADGEAPTEPEWRRAFREAAEAVEVAGFSSRRLRKILDDDKKAPPPQWREFLDAFHADVERMRGMRRELEDLGNPWPDAGATLLRDPDRREDAEELLASARERVRPFPDLPSGPGLEGVSTDFSPMAIRAVERVLAGDRPEYNPLFLHAREGDRARAFLEAVGRTFRARRPSARVGLISLAQFADEFIRAITRGVAGAWRERWWTVDLLLLHGLEGLSGTERAQEEVFHLLEALKRRGARILLASSQPPSAISGVDDRLRSRFEGGLVVSLSPDAAEEDGGSREERTSPSPRAGLAVSVSGADPALRLSSEGEGEEGSDPDSVLAALRAFAGVSGSAGRGRAGRDGVGPEDGGDGEGGAGRETWYPSAEKVVWNWRPVRDRIVDEDHRDPLA